MKNRLHRYESFLLAVIEMAIGILLLIRPIGFTNAVIMCVAAFSVIHGLMSLISYCRNQIQNPGESHAIVKGLSLIAVGMFCLFHSEELLAAFPVITTLYGVLILLTSFYKLQWTFDMYRLKLKYWYVPLIGAMISFAVSALIFWNPVALTAALWKISGITLIVGAVSDILTYIFSRISFKYRSV